ncbi:hypothetical protein NUW58_g1024 [Xylaria curta]|uniref:Uncharacterized protein n=1 Tax=Xylaria curta TaxID=42375 RepID=A0ACC1PMK5_9PEZI|nr:hypothetical protein NUW58_g1024 [Xylaria curta]
MDRLETLKLPIRASHSRTTPVAAAVPPETMMKSNRQSARSHAKKTRRKYSSAPNSVLNSQCRTEEAYTCHLSLLILLHTKSYNTLHPIRQDDSQRSIEFDFASFPSASYRVFFNDLLEALCCQETLPSKLPYLDALQQSLIDALQLLHFHNISFPVSTNDIEFSRHVSEQWRDIRSLKLFLPFNKKACWASDKLPPSWKADQLACAESIFLVPKLLTRLAVSPQPTLLDFASQQALTVYLRENPTFQHDKYCLGIHPLTAELAHQIAYCLVMRNMAEKSREILESFFGGPMPLPELGTPPDMICSTLSSLRARAVESEKHHGSNTMPYQDLEAKLLVDSPAMVTRFVCCRAKVAFVLRDPGERQWWLAAMGLYDAFLSSQGPSSRVGTASSGISQASQPAKSLFGEQVDVVVCSSSYAVGPIPVPPSLDVRLGKQGKAKRL